MSLVCPASTSALKFAQLLIARRSRVEAPQVLCRSCATRSVELDVPFRVTASSYGPLRHVPPALERADEPLECDAGPPAYGSSQLEWKPRPEDGVAS